MMIHVIVDREYMAAKMFALWLVALVQVAGQLPAARITAILPLGSEVGSEEEVQVYGTDLDGPLELRFSHPGITAELSNPEKHRFLVRVSSDVPVGVYDVRFVGALGCSNPRLFAVSSLVESLSSGKNTSLEKASNLEENTVVNGATVARQSIWFKMSAIKGQRLFLRVTAAALDSRMNPVMYLRDHDGKRLARATTGGLIDYTAASDAEYFVQIHDATYGGGVDYYFRLERTSGPHVDFVFPPMVERSDSAEVTLYGRNLPDGVNSQYKSLDGRELEQITIKISDLVRGDRPGGVLLPSASAAIDGGVFRLFNDGMTSNPFFIGLFDEKSQGLEQGDNETYSKAQPISAPGLVCGRFFPIGDVDFFRFSIQKGEIYWLNIYSQRLGNKTNPYITTRLVRVDKNGKEIMGESKEFYEMKDNPGGHEFNVSNRDVSWRFQAGHDGYCLVSLRDLFNHAEADLARGYALALIRERPNFRILAHPRTVSLTLRKTKAIQLMVAHLRNGATLPIQMVVLREGGFNGPIEVTAQGLPDGVILHPCVIKAGQKNATALISAIKPTTSFVGDIRFVGTAEIDGIEVKRQGLATVTTHPVGDYDKEPVFSRLTKSCALSVNIEDVEPIQVTAVGNGPFTGLANGNLKIPLKINRTGEYNEAIKFKVYGMSQLQKLPELSISNEQGEATLEIDLAKFKVPAGSYTIQLGSTIKGKYQFPPLNEKKTDKKKDVTFQLISPPIIIEVKPVPKPE